MKATNKYKISRNKLQHKRTQIREIKNKMRNERGFQEDIRRFIDSRESQYDVQLDHSLNPCNETIRDILVMLYL